MRGFSFPTIGVSREYFRSEKRVRGHGSGEGERTGEDEGGLFFSGKLDRRSLGHNRVEPAAKERRPLFLANAPFFSLGGHSQKLGQHIAYERK